LGGTPERRAADSREGGGWCQTASASDVDRHSAMELGDEGGPPAVGSPDLARTRGRGREME